MTLYVGVTLYVGYRIECMTDFSNLVIARLVIIIITQKLLCVVEVLKQRF